LEDNDQRDGRLSVLTKTVEPKSLKHRHRWANLSSHEHIEGQLFQSAGISEFFSST
jgi:hypothetical protein